MVALLTLAAGSNTSMAIDLGSTQTDSRQVVPTATKPIAAARTSPVPFNGATDQELAQMWHLSVPEIQRARVLMQGPRGAFSSPQLSPIEALGIHAANDAERLRYARLLAKIGYEDTLRVLAWSRVVQAEAQSITAGQPVLDFSDVPKAHVSVEAADMLGVPRLAIVPTTNPTPRLIKTKPMSAAALGPAADNRSPKKRPGEGP